jgi:uncharacterized repeat protein (TIGR01451 family)
MLPSHRIFNMKGLPILLAGAVPCLLLLALFQILFTIEEAHASGNLTVEISAGYNLVVDSNVLSPSTYAPSVATVMGEFCNSGDAPLSDVQGFIGDFNPSLPESSTPGVYPGRDSGESAFAVEHPHLANSGEYSFMHVGGRAGLVDASRYMGTLEPGECRVQYWHFSYPRRGNPDNSGPAVWGTTRDPLDDLWLEFDMWATAAEGALADATWKMTMRNEISAMANKIQPNPAGRWFNTDASQVRPGSIITSNGILYDLGNINKGFDNNGDFVYDYNAWLQPIGDPSYDPSCFRLIRTTGVLTVSRSGGQSDLIIPFENQLYFTDLPENNTGALGQVHYAFLALDGPCSTRLTPYQEVASGADNEKFNADFGAGIPPVGSFEPEVTIDKQSDPDVVLLGGTINYQIPVHNGGTESAGLPLHGMPLVVSDSLPEGTEYIAGSATSDGDVTVLYSTDNGLTWTGTEPVPASAVTTIRWLLNEPLAAGESFTPEVSVGVPGSYSGDVFIENEACAAYGDSSCFEEAQSTTLLSGNNQIGDLVWHDVDGDGVQEAGESGLPGIGVALYWDADGDGQLSEVDIFVMETETSASGTYLFDELPDANFLVQVDVSDGSLPQGFVATTLPVYVAALDPAGNDANAVVDDSADFGFSPVLSLQKSRVSSDPLYEGQLVDYRVELINTRPGDGSGEPAACTVEVWATQESADSAAYNKPFTDRANAFGASGPDGLFASATYDRGADRFIGGTGFDAGLRSGAVTKVEVLFFAYVDPALDNDYLEGTLYSSGTQLGTHTFTTAELNSNFVGLENAGLLSWDITGLRTWSWQDFANDLELRLTAAKTQSGDITIAYVDALGFRITTDESCGGPADTIVTLPLTDTYDPTQLEFVAGNPAPSSVDPGVLRWDNLGPLFAGQTKEISVTFRMLEGPDTDSDGESDPMQVSNTAQATGRFSDGQLTNEAQDSTNDTAAPAGTIGDIIWNDNGGPLGTGTAANGIQDGDEQGLPGVTIQLYRDEDGNGAYTAGTDTLVANAITGANGEYLFQGVTDGQYVVVVDETTLPGSGLVQTADPDGTPDGESAAQLANNNGDPADDDRLELDFGYQVPSTIFGNVWHDADGSGVQDSAEPGLNGWTVELVDGTCTAGVDCLTTTTGSDGDYVFSDLLDGSYQVRIQPPPDWNQTVDPEDNNDHQSATITVSGGNLYGSYDFAYRQVGALSIGDLVYQDWNGDGVVSPGEAGIPGVPVALYLDSDVDGILDDASDPLVASTTTNGSGFYLFDELPDGPYLVVVGEGALPDTYQQTEDPDESGVCTACDEQASVVLSASTDNIDFGYQPRGYGLIGDFVWQDTDGDGIQDDSESGISGVTVYLYHDQDGNGLLDSAEDALVAEVESDDTGHYLFAALAAGDYLVVAEQSDPALPTDGYGEPYIVSVTTPIQVALGTDEQYHDADIGFTAGGTIGDFVWQDNNGNGTQDGGEPGIAGVGVSLYEDVNSSGAWDAGDILLENTVTDSDGYYDFTSLTAGDYIVVIDNASNLAAFTATGDPDEGPPCTTCDHESGVTLAAGQIDRSRDFGYRPPGAVGDLVWLDVNQNGEFDLGEPGLSGVEVTLSLQGSGQLITFTDGDGLYSFGNLPDGTHTVTIDQGSLLSGLAPTADPDESGTCLVCDHSATVAINNGASDFTVDFGYVLSGVYSISGVAFFDSNQDGSDYQLGDELLANVPVHLWYDSNGDGRGDIPLGSTLTGSDGSYNFSGLPAGKYTAAVNHASSRLDGLTLTTAIGDNDGTAYEHVNIVDEDVSQVDFGFYGQQDPTAVTLNNLTTSPLLARSPAGTVASIALITFVLLCLQILWRKARLSRDSR